MSEKENLPTRQNAVNHDNDDPRPPRSSVGDVFTSLVVEVASLGGRFSEIGEELAKEGGQTLARWVVLDAVAVDPAPVAHVAQSLGQARQSVQRIADLLVEEGLCVFEDNPAHRRAKLLRLDEKGRDSLRAISQRQKSWADAVGAEIGADELTKTRDLLSNIADVVSRHPT